jgi:nucleoside-diphosphate-sugar epimerase
VGVLSVAKYLVIGGAGFIGSNVVHRLLEDGEKVVVYDDFSTGHEENLEDVERRSDLSVQTKDIRELTPLKRAMRGCDFVLHQAALPSVPRSIKDPFASNDVNVLGTLNVLHAAKEVGVQRVVFASSSSVYGENPSLPKVESMVTAPVSPYAVTKLAGEEYCRVYYHIHGVEVVALRYFNVFGPRQDPGSQYAAVVPKFITSILRGRPPTIFGDGKQSRDFTYIDNVVDANLAACVAAKAAGEAINIACGSRVTISGLANFISSIAGKEIAPKFDKPRGGDIRHSLADVTKARELLGYRPRVGIEEGLRRTVDWYSKRPR